jgi:hypothetical protein
MRVYLYDAESGLYEGEDFCDDRELNENDGITTLAPPTVMLGHVAVFDAELRRWKQVPIAESGGANNA